MKFAFLAATLAATLAGCGTTYQISEIDPGTASTAARMFAEASSDARRAPAGPAEALARFERVVARVRPVAERLCADELGRGVAACGARIGIDTAMPVPNAYFTYADEAKREPRIMVTVPMLRDVANDDELAFVVAHEYGHLIGQHIQKAEQQALAGALLLGVIAAAATHDMPHTPYRQDLIEDSMSLGGAVGSKAFSQTYELESDTLGTAIARMAGFDPVAGARYFARPAPERAADGGLSFWGTHPPDETRMATVIATNRQIDEHGGLVRKR
ncbi:M48 family metalloprotease [Jannaschia sp. W003]|uniref:M48 family metalloprotease n=1 Tax=Jannaschia sp. W003 TaxID=2867012 RepID=UPI0021A47451|nr:M48 family metalloprotease [Jannaschia sp. W003]UWQ22463.1 M48 family metalloprotease [Jannaschia sp. W003]